MASASSVRREVSETAASPRLDRVLYVLNLEADRKFGSMEEQVFEMAREFQRRGGFLLPVFSTPLSQEAAELYQSAGLSAVALPLVWFKATALRELLRVVQRERIDVIHWNFFEAIKNPYLWALTLLRPGLRHRFTQHNSRFDPDLSTARSGLADRIKRIAMRRYERIYGVSDYVLRAHAGSLPAGRARVWRQFVNTERFYPDPQARCETRRRLGVPEGTFVIVLIANMIKWKGVDVAIEAVRRLPAGTELWAVGTGPEEGAYIELAQRLDVADRVRFLGMTYNVTPLIQAADCLACPSIWGEALGLVNLEGMACGAPVVASAVGGIPEFLRDGENGLLVPPGDADALARAFQRLRDDPALRERLGREARASAVRMHSPASRLDEHIAEYLTTHRS